MHSIRTFLAALLLTSSIWSPAFAGAGTITVLDSTGATQTFNVITDVSNHFVGKQGICDQAAAANCAGVDAGHSLQVAGEGTAGTAAGGVVTIQGSTATGGVLASNPILVAGSDGTDVRNLSTDASGRQIVVGAAASGGALAGNPVLVAGSDGTDARNISTNASGQVVVVGAGVAGTGSGGVVSVQGIAGGTNLPVSQGTAANLNATVVGTGTFAVQATLQATPTTAIGKVDPNTIATWGLMVGTTPGTAPTNTAVVGGIYNSSAPTPSTGQTLPFQLDSSGNLNVNIKAGAGSGGTAIADEASFTQGTTQGTPMFGLYTTSVVNLTTGQTGIARLTNDRTLITTEATTSQLSTTIGAVGGSAGCTAGGSNNLIECAYATYAAITGPLPYTPVTSYGSSPCTGYTAGTASAVCGDQKGAIFVNLTPNTGTAGSANAAVLTVQGIASMTPLLVNPGTAANFGVGATGSAPPANAIYLMANASGAVGGHAKGLIICDLSATYDASTNGKTQLVAGTGSELIYICGYQIGTGGTATLVSLGDGTGTNCGTTYTAITPAYQLGANDRTGMNSSFWNGLSTINTGDELCVSTSAGNPVQVTLFYTKL